MLSWWAVGSAGWLRPTCWPGSARRSWSSNSTTRQEGAATPSLTRASSLTSVSVILLSFCVWVTVYVHISNQTALTRYSTVTLHNIREKKLFEKATASTTFFFFLCNTVNVDIFAQLNFRAYSLREHFRATKFSRR